MNIEIRKAGFINKGAELMLYAILEKLKPMYPEARFIMAPHKNAPFEKRAALKLWQKAWYWRYKVQWGDLAGLLPKKTRESYGIVLDREVDVVLDAAGFAYSEQLSEKTCTELARSCKRWKKNGRTIILLPQAFGPFTTDNNKEKIRLIADCAGLIFAREQASYKYLVDITGERPNIKTAPDFTNLLQGKVPEYFNYEENDYCIIPNHRMINKTKGKDKEAYLPFLIKCIQYLISKNKKPFILVHEGAKDHQLAIEISNAVNASVPVYTESDPLKVKGIIGACKGVLGSRFHSLVSALSQGVPALGTGWSHKYEMLFRDYDFPEGIINVTAREQEISWRRLVSFFQSAL
ncbi:MAG: polysaccharide pyruvyl transferase family protein [Bacteroidales bacterium]